LAADVADLSKFQ